MNSHPSPLTLERFSVGDLQAEAQETTRAHVQVCLACRGALDEMERARSDCLRHLPAEVLLAQINKGRRPRVPRWSWLGLGALSAAAAGLALLFFLPSDGVKLKGTGVAIYRQRGDEVRLLGPEQGIRAGDGLRVVLTLPKRQPAAAWFVDARGRVDRFLSDGSSTLDRGERALPGSAIVESPCVDLWLIVATGSGAAERLESSFQKARQDRLPPGEGWAPAGAVVRPIRCE
jgi:hypothetical protein